MKNTTKTLFLVFFFFSISNFGQKNEFNLIQLDSTWGQEVLRFPARNMNYTGVGEVRFPPKGWINPEHPNFWSYTYAWNINVNRKINANELASNLVKYFNSLNKIDMNDLKNSRKSTASIKKTKTKKSTTFFEGKATIFDRFATQKMLVLNVKIESHFCKKLQKTVLLFTFSPKEFNHKTWEILDEIKLINEGCNN